MQEKNIEETPKVNKEVHVYKEGESHNHDEEVTEKEHEEVHFKAIEVVPGTTDLGCAEIKLVEEIPANAKIVVKGAFYLLATSKCGGEHVH
jgi:cobalt-zinc-cadmium efflux system membrane fusion protein